MKNPLSPLLVALLLAPCSTVAASDAGPWSDVPEGALPMSAGERLIVPKVYRTLALDVAALESLLRPAPEPFVVSLPLPDGTFGRFRAEESPIMEPELAVRYPELRTFRAQGLDDPTATVRFDLVPAGFHALILSAGGTVYIDPYRKGDRDHYISYWRHDYPPRPGDSPFICSYSETLTEEQRKSATTPTAPDSLSGIHPLASWGTTLRNYRLAVAATGEYTAFHGGTVAAGMAAIVVSMNRVNGIYEREVAVHMNLVANNDLVVYTNAATDPYTNGDGYAMLPQNQTNLDTVIGTANYDMGHVFSTGGGGVANLSGICSSFSKARGVTGRGAPVGDPFDVDYVAHEMGHQFGANHTYNGTAGYCGTRVASAAYEPGSGSTIMAYAGICAAQDLQPNSDPYFHVKSFDEITTFLAAGGNSCADAKITGNNPPAVNAGPSYTIPSRTPFALTGSASDPDGDPLVYCWEEFDLGSATSAPPDTDTTGARPIFRSFNPVPSPTRVFPKLSDILSGTATYGESLPTIDRTMTFRLTARDNRALGGGVNYAATTVAVSAASGPFQVTAPNTAVSWTGLTSQTVSWNVAGTSGPPVSCADVKVTLSTDGGLTFPQTLLASTPNSGSAPVTIPNTPTAAARVKVECATNVFFDISDTSFTILPGSWPAPAVAGVVPASGPVTGGIPVTLTGTGFRAGASVTVGGVAARDALVESDTLIRATIGAHAAGTVDVVVTNEDARTGTLTNGFQYVADPGTLFFPLTPCRLVDTRSTDPPSLQPSGAERAFPLAGSCGIPPNARAVALNFAAVSQGAGENFRAFPGNGPAPAATTVSFKAGQVRANSALLLLASDGTGTIKVKNDATAAADLIVDVSGYFF